MHDIKWIREHKEEFDRGLARRGLPPEAKRLIEMDERRRAAIQKAEAALARRNRASREIGAAKKSNEEAAAQALMAEVARLKAEIPALETEEKKLSEELDAALAQIPNLPLLRKDTPINVAAALMRGCGDSRSGFHRCICERRR
jgi:seryl-tRNA synthetase